jgi:hypothetical protein
VGNKPVTCPGLFRFEISNPCSCTGTDIAVRAVSPVDGALRVESTTASASAEELEEMNWEAELEVNMMDRAAAR